MANDKPWQQKIVESIGRPYHDMDRKYKGLPTKAEKDRERKDLRTKLAEERDKNFKLGQQLADVTTEKKQLETDLRDSDRRLWQRINEVTNLRHQVGTLQTQLAEQRSENDQQKKDLEVLRIDNRKLNDTNKDQNDKISNLEGKLGRRNITISDLEANISHLEDIRVDQDAQITLLKSLLRPRDNEIAKLKSSLTHRDNEISSLKDSLTRRNNDVSNLKDSLTRRDNEVFNLKDLLTRRDNEISNLKGTVKAQETQISILEDTVRDLRRGGGRPSGPRAGSEDEHSPDPPMLSDNRAEYREWRPQMQEKAKSYRRAARRSEREVMEYIASWIDYPLRDEVDEIIPAFRDEEKLWRYLDRRFGFSPPTGGSGGPRTRGR